MAKKSFAIIGLFCMTILLSSMTLHKFYVSVNQIQYVPEKKVVQITSRFFVDDINNALEKKFKTRFYLGSKEETPQQLEQLKKYLTENFSIKINDKSKTMDFLAKELEDDVLIFYFTIKDVGKIKSMEIKNTMLFDFIPEQQNIIHTQVSGVKKSILLTESNRKELLKY